MYAIETFDLVKKFGSLIAVDHINLKVKEGIIFGYLGPNGAGKTTTIRMLTTALKPTSGTASVGGYDVIQNSAEVRKRIAVMQQGPALDPYLTVYDELWIYGRLYGIPKQELKSKIKYLLERFGLVDRCQQKVELLSMGLMRLVQLMRVFIANRSILFLDEPTRGVDPISKRNVWRFIKEEIMSSGKTVFLTTQDMFEAEQVCDIVAIINRGKIVACDTPSALTRISRGHR